MIQLQKDFLNLIKKIGLDSTICNTIANSWEVKDIDFQSKTKKVDIQLKQLKIVPIELIIQLAEKIKISKFNINLIWRHQTDWGKDLLNIKSYITFFLMSNFSDLDLIFSKFSLTCIQVNKLKLEIQDSKFYQLVNSNKVVNSLVHFLESYGIFISEINFFLESSQQKIVNSTKQLKFIDPDKKNIEAAMTKFNLDFVEGKILSVDNRMFSNKQTFFFLLEIENHAKKCVFSREATAFDPYRDTDLLKKGKWLRVYLDTNGKGNLNLVKKFEEIPPIFFRDDVAKEKRVELHVHTKMSALDGIGEITDYLAYANHWQHKAIAITDHQNVHIFPECDQLAQKYPDLKIIFGCEFEFLADSPKVITGNLKGLITNAKLLFFDIETTGLSSYFDEIIEFAGIVVQNSMPIVKKSFLIQSKKKIPDQIYQFTHISEKEHQIKAIPFKEAMKEIKSLFANNVCVAHNANFDINFLNIAFAKAGLSKITNPVIDTLNLSRFVNYELKSHRLQRLAKRYKISHSKLKSHRAIYDTKVLEQLFERIVGYHQIKTFEELYVMNGDERIYKNTFYRHLTALVKNKKGLHDLYYLVSHTHTKTLYKKPVLMKKDLEKKRHNLLIGSSCYNGEVFNAACFEDDDVLDQKIVFYDYIEIQPLEVYQHLVTKQIISEEDLKKAVWRVIKSAKKLNKMVVATGDVHYLDSEHFIYRDIFIFNKQLRGEWHDLYDFQNRLKRSPPQYFRTTDEMLKAFDFLEDPHLIFEIVVKNSNFIADQVDKIHCFDKNFIMPQFINSDQELKKALTKKVFEKYGSSLDPALQKRLDWELKQIIDAKYSTIYLISYYLTEYSTKQKFFFGSRGSVGSSFVAYCLDITEVNPLLPHYLCAKCHYFEWVNNDNYLSGFDLPKKKCSKCQVELIKNGHEISFESFLGIDSENIPDIDLNFSGEFQQQAQKFVVDLFTKKIGKNKIFWTGTVSTVAQKLAYGYYKSFLENHGTKNILYNEEEKIIVCCSGVKKTTGQHPGGLMIIPKEKDILDFSPYNYPSNNKEAGNFTTHFDYHVLHNHLLKIDILGHDDPTGLKLLYEMTGCNPKKIDLGDKEIINLFNENKVLGLPEFGTGFVIQLLKQVEIKNFADLIAVSGLSHGKNVWESNAKDLIKNKKNNLSTVISCRDDILLFLIKKGVEKRFAYQIMQKVKKGIFLSNIEEKKLQSHNIPQWYIDSCKKIKYLFPKAHAVAYVIMACRFAWFKIKHPHEFYASYFTIHSTVFDLKTILEGKEAIQQKMTKIGSHNRKWNNNISAKDKTLLSIYEVVLEMLDSGVEIVDLNLDLSKATEFIVQEINCKKVIIPPFNIVDYLGVEFSKKIVTQREKKKFSSQEDFKSRTRINQTAFDNLVKLNLFKNTNKNIQNTFDF